MRNLLLAALATGCVLASVGAVSAKDTVRLGGPSAENAIRGGTSAELVHWRHHHFGYGFHRPYYGGGYYRPYYASYYRPYYYPRVSVYATFPSYYYTPSYYYYPSPVYYSPAYYGGYYYPIAGEPIAAPATTTSGYAPKPVVAPMPPAGDGTFPYDGGPRSTAPMPSDPPRGTIPIDGRLVFMPTEVTGGTTQIYMPAPRTPESRVTYPAYGEEPIAPAPRKIIR